MIDSYHLPAHAALHHKPYRANVGAGGADDDHRRTSLSFLGIGLKPPVASQSLDLLLELKQRLDLSLASSVTTSG
jgi:hypothetical protein